MSHTSNITIEQNTQHEYKYLITLDPANAVSNWMFRANEGNIIEVKLSIVTPVISDAAIASYVGERETVLFTGKHFVSNNETTWTYLESIILSGITPADWTKYMSDLYGGYYNHSEVITASSAAVASDVIAKYVMLEPYLVNNNPKHDNPYSYV